MTRHEAGIFAVVGSRTFSDYKLLETVLDEFEIEEIITGGARGADRLAETYADARGIKKRVIRPDYDRYGRPAPLVRNRVIVDLADRVVAFWDGKSRGTRSVIDYAGKKNKQVTVIQGR